MSFMRYIDMILSGYITDISCLVRMLIRSVLSTVIFSLLASREITSAEIWFYSLVALSSFFVGEIVKSHNSLSCPILCVGMYVITIYFHFLQLESTRRWTVRIDFLRSLHFQMTFSSTFWNEFFTISTACIRTFAGFVLTWDILKMSTSIINKIWLRVWPPFCRHYCMVAYMVGLL